MIGTRGIPANYGGFETCVEEIGKRLAKRGHDVTVYCRKSYYKNKLSDYFGMKLVYLPNLKRKSFDTLSHTFLSAIHGLFSSYDLLMVFNAANSPTMILPRLFGAKIVINTDALEDRPQDHDPPLVGQSCPRSKVFRWVFACRLPSRSMEKGKMGDDRKRVL